VCTHTHTHTHTHLVYINVYVNVSLQDYCMTELFYFASALQGDMAWLMISRKMRQPKSFYWLEKHSTDTAKSRIQSHKLQIRSSVLSTVLMKHYWKRFNRTMVCGSVHITCWCCVVSSDKSWMVNQLATQNKNLHNWPIIADNSVILFDLGVKFKTYLSPFKEK